jgi:hypothetical protein
MAGDSTINAALGIKKDRRDQPTTSRGVDAAARPQKWGSTKLAMPVQVLSLRSEPTRLNHVLTATASHSCVEETLLIASGWAKVIIAAP